MFQDSPIHHSTLLFALVVIGLAACAPPSLRPSPEELAMAEATPGAARIRAEEVRLQGARRAEKTPGMVDEVELRISDRSGEDYLEPGEGTRLAVQVPFRTPWEASAEKKARKEVTTEIRSRLDRATLQREVEACVAGTALSAARARHESFEPYAARLRELLNVIERQYAARVITESEALRVEMDARTRLVDQEPRPPVTTGYDEVPLPVFDGVQPTLATSPETIRDLIRTHHPDPQIHDAASRRYSALASKELAAALPWIDDIRLSYDFPRDNRNQLFGARLAVRVPFGRGERAQAAAYRGQSAGESFEAAARVAEHHQRATAALNELVFLESRAEHWSQLLELAERSESTAARLLEEGHEEPSRLVSLLSEAQAARRAVISARERAALASCALLESTGVRLDEWPREPSN